MEKEGFMRIVNRLDELLSLNVISTDRQNQIKKLMREAARYRHLTHQFDPWHFARSIKKKLLKLFKKKGINNSCYSTDTICLLETIFNFTVI